MRGSLFCTLTSFLSRQRLCRNTRNLIDVMLSKAKHLAFSGCYKVEILRLRPQNDIATQSLKGEEAKKLLQASARLLPANP
jgi:hypothetical protein